MKEAISNRPDTQHFFRNQTTPPPPDKTKITFPNGPKQVENGKLKENGKKKPNRSHKEQPTLWKSSGN